MLKKIKKKYKVKKKTTTTGGEYWANKYLDK